MFFQFPKLDFRSTGLHWRQFQRRRGLQEQRRRVRLPLPLQGHVAQRLHGRRQVRRLQVVRHEGRPEDQRDVGQLLGSLPDVFVSD